jgi:hypothetical protein
MDLWNGTKKNPHQQKYADGGEILKADLKINQRFLQGEHVCQRDRGGNEVLHGGLFLW